MIGPRMVSYTQIGKDETAENLHAAFLGGIGSRTEPAREIAVKPVLCPGSVAALMQPDPSLPGTEKLGFLLFWGLFWFGLERWGHRA